MCSLGEENKCNLKKEDAASQRTLLLWHTGDVLFWQVNFWQFSITKLTESANILNRSRVIDYTNMKVRGEHILVRHS